MLMRGLAHGARVTVRAMSAFPFGSEDLDALAVQYAHDHVVDEESILRKLYEDRHRATPERSDPRQPEDAEERAPEKSEKE